MPACVPWTAAEDASAQRTLAQLMSRVGDASKGERLGWVPRITFEELVRQMVDADLELLAAEHKV